MSALAHSRTPLAPTLELPEKPVDPRGLGGLIARCQGREQALPLKEVTVRTHIAGHCARTVIDQVFANSLNTAMEAVHLFPLPEDGALIEMELRCGDLVVKADCKEKEEARKDFQAARIAGHRAALVQQERADIHSLNITNLPAGEEVTVRLVVVEALDSIDGQFRWRFPTTIAPRYTPGEAIGHQGDGVSPDTDEVPDASRISPPIRLKGGTKLDLEVRLQGPVKNLESSLHAVKMSIDGGGIALAPSGKATLNKDFVLAFSTGDESDVALRAWTDGEFTVAVIEPPLIEMPKTLPRDAVFVVDISGSMGVTKMTAAKQALSLALHGLMPGDRFKLIAFDDRLELFAADFTDYDDSSLAKADAWIERLYARGGTTMLPAVQKALEGSTPKGRLRTVLFVTDGQASNENPLVAAVANRRSEARFFTMGIDTAVNSNLLKRMARAGGGTCELATPSDDIEAIMSRIEARFGSPVVTQIQAQGGEAARGGELDLFTGRPATVLLKGAPERVKVEGLQQGGAFVQEVKPAKVDFPLGALWARTRIRFLEDRLTLRPFEEEALKPLITKLALKYTIASRYTSFIAVEKSSKIEGGERVKVVQSHELPDQWQSQAALQRSGLRPGAAPGMMANHSMMSRSMQPPPPMSRPMPAPSPSPMPAGGMTGAMPPGASGSFGGGMPAPSPADFMKKRDVSERKRAAPKRRREKSEGLLGKIKGFFGAKSEEAEAPMEDLDDAMADASLSIMSMPQPPSAAAPMASASMSFKAPTGRQDAGSGPQESGDPAKRLAKLQGADGSFGGSVERTVAALLALILLGHTRRKGLRRRAVMKAAQWLGQQSHKLAEEALAALKAAEEGQSPEKEAWKAWSLGSSAEKTLLDGLL